MLVRSSSTPVLTIEQPIKLVVWLRNRAARYTMRTDLTEDPPMEVLLLIRFSAQFHKDKPLHIIDQAISQATSQVRSLPNMDLVKEAMIGLSIHMVQLNIPPFSSRNRLLPNQGVIQLLKVAMAGRSDHFLLILMSGIALNQAVVIVVLILKHYTVTVL